MMGPGREAVRKTPRYSNMKAMSNCGRSRWCRTAFALAAFAAFSVAPAQDYPSRPVRVVVPSAPGGGFDLVGRVLAQKLAEQTGQAFVVEKRPGAGTLVGTQLVARSAPDGYNLIVGGLSNIALNMGLYREPGYDSLADFTCAGLVVSHSYTLVARKDLPLASLVEVIAFARANPGKLNIGTSGPGTGSTSARPLSPRSPGWTSSKYPTRARSRCTRICSLAASTCSTTIRPPHVPTSSPGRSRRSRCRAASARRPCRSFPRSSKPAWSTWKWTPGSACLRPRARRVPSSSACAPRWTAQRARPRCARAWR